MKKRIITATLLGIVMGLICTGIASSGGKLPAPVLWQIIFSRTLIGFAIGISCLAAVPWALHGLLMGCIFSLPLAFSGLMAPETPEFSKTSMFVWTVILGMVYGLLIEVVTSKVLKARIGA